VQKSEKKFIWDLKLEMVDFKCFFEKNGLGPLVVNIFFLNFLYTIIISIALNFNFYIGLRAWSLFQHALDESH
jgi:hypothetical protein